MTIIAQIIVGIVLGLVTLWVQAKGAAPSSVVQPRRDALRERLRQRVRTAGWTLALLLLCGCRAPAIYIPPGEPVRIARPIRNATVEIILPSGQTALRTLTIPAGWYALPDPAETLITAPAVIGGHTPQEHP